MSLRRLVPLALLSAAAALCLPAAARADLRIEESRTGLDSRVTRWIFLKERRRSIVSRTEASGTLYQAGARPGASVEIARPDRQLIWELDPQARSYRTVTAAEFRRLLQAAEPLPQGARVGSDQPLRSLYDTEAGPVEVVPMGRTRRIAGLPAEGFRARVAVAARNRTTGAAFRFTFEQEVWLARDTRLLRELREFDEAYAAAFGSTLTLAQVRLMAGRWSDAFLPHLRALEECLRTLEGFPLAMTTTVTEEALPRKEGERTARRQLTVASSEVRKLSFDPIPETEFEPPAGYTPADAAAEKKEGGKE